MGVMSLGDIMDGLLHEMGNINRRWFPLLDASSFWRFLRKTSVRRNIRIPLGHKKAVLRYRPDTDQVLKECSFKFEGGQKIGICGRTGAGKSTLSMAITRIVEREAGAIKIDGVDVNKISLKQV